MSKRHLWIGSSSQEFIESEANRMAPLETGGIVLGYVGQNGDYVVDQVTGPGPNSIHSRTRFCPDHGYQKERIDKVFYDSNGVIDYLGDWHTHPNSPCGMSWVDRRTLARIGTAPEVNLKRPIMLIACRDNREWGARAWRYLRNRWFLGADTEEVDIEIY